MRPHRSVFLCQRINFIGCVQVVLSDRPTMRGHAVWAQACHAVQNAFRRIPPYAPVLRLLSELLCLLGVVLIVRLNHAHRSLRTAVQHPQQPDRGYHRNRSTIQPDSPPWTEPTFSEIPASRRQALRLGATRTQPDKHWSPLSLFLRRVFSARSSPAKSSTTSGRYGPFRVKS